MSEPNDRDRAVAERIIACDEDHFPEDIRSYLPEFLTAYREEIAAQAERALRTRSDYDFRCDDCGAPHNLDTSIPSPIWNAICENREGIKPGAAGIGMKEVGALCTLCIEERLIKAGLTCEAEFYFCGAALQSKMYALPSTGDLERAKREGFREALEQAETALHALYARATSRWRNDRQDSIKAIRDLLPPGEPQEGRGE